MLPTITATLIFGGKRTRQQVNPMKEINLTSDRVRLPSSTV